MRYQAALRPDCLVLLVIQVFLAIGRCLDVANCEHLWTRIHTYFTPENFNYSYFNELGNVTTQLLKDGITRFIMGRYKTMKEAEALRDKALKIGDRDAFIVIYYNGERMLISEAITKEF